MSRIITALVTPFKSNFELDLDRWEPLLRAQQAAGIREWILFGSTGEGATLRFEERETIIRHVLKLVPDPNHVWVGVGTASTQETIARAQQAESLGIKNLLVVTPYYNKPSQRGLLDHYERIQEATNANLIAYQVPSRTGGIRFELDTLLQLAKLPRVVGLKDSSGDLNFFARAKQALHKQARSKPFSLFIGEDTLFLPALALGCDGLISVASHLVAEELLLIQKNFMEAATLESIHDSRQRFLRLFPLLESLFIESNPIPVKAYLARLGLMTSTVRPPLLKMQRSEVIDALFSEFFE